MSILKPEVGAPVVLTVTGCRSVKGKFRQEYEFGGQDGVVYVGVDAADRQLSRLNLTPDTVIGRTLEFEKVEKDGKKFLNINFAGGGGNGTAGAATAARTTGQSATHTTTSATQPTPAPQPEKPLTGHALYEKITDYVLGTIAPKYTKAGIGLSPEAAAAICATLYIAASKNGN